MNRTIEEATLRRFHDDRHDRLRTPLADFMGADSCARRLKPLNGPAPYAWICKIWTSKPDGFILDPMHQKPGLNT